MFDSVIRWLNTPFSGVLTHTIDSNSFWHGRLMVIAWCFLIPIAIIVARYFKVMPKQDWPTNLDNKFWWFVHRYFVSVR